MGKINYTTETMARGTDGKIRREIITFDEPSRLGESVRLVLSYRADGGRINSKPKLWYKYGFIDRLLETYIDISVVVTDKDANCLEKYNPQIIKGEKTDTINFDWMLEATEENREKIINKVYELMTKIGRASCRERV